jgi:WD40 repeat protein
MLCDFFSGKGTAGLNDLPARRVGRTGMQHLLAWLTRLIDLIFGYDFFISYAWHDGPAYPSRLSQQLEASRYKVFLDKTGYVAGADLRMATRRRVKMSTVLVVVLRPHALKSDWVLKEVQESITARRSIIIVDVNQTFANAPDDQPLKQFLTNLLRIQETLPILDDAPSPNTIAEILRSFKFTRRETLRLWVGGVIAALFVAAVTIGSYQYANARQADRIRRVNEIVAEAGNLASDPAKLDQAAEKASEAVSWSTTLAVTPVLRRFLALWPPVDERTIACNPNNGPDCDIELLKFSPDGSRLAIGTESGSVFLAETQSRQIHLVTKHAKRVQDMGFSQDGHWVLSLGEKESSVRLCAIGGVSCLETPVCGDEVAAIAVAPASLGNVVAVGGANGICLVDIDSRKILRQIPASVVKVLRFSSNGNTLAAVLPKRIQLWSLPNLRLKASASLPEWEVTTLDPMFKKIIVSRNKEGFVVDIPSGRSVAFEHPDFIRDIDVNPAGTQFATAAADLRATEYAARLFDIENVGQFQRFAQQGQVTTAKFFADGSHLLTASGPHNPYDGSARLWDLVSRQLSAYMVNAGPVTALAIHRSDKIATASWNGVVKIWNMSARSTKEFDLGGRILRVRFHPRAAAAAVLYRGKNGGALVTISKSGELLRTNLDMLSIEDVAYSPTGEFLAVAGDSAITLFRDNVPVKKIAVESAIDFCDFAGRDKIVVSAKNQILVSDIKNDSRQVFVGAGEPLASTLDGAKVAIGGTSHLRLLDLSAHKQITMPGGAGAVSSAAFNIDGKILAAGYRKNSPEDGLFGPGICLWNTESAEQAQQLGCIKTTNGILSVALHPSENILVSGDEFGVVQFWDLLSHAELARLEYPTSVETVSFDDMGTILRVAVYGSTASQVEVEAAPWRPQDLVRESCLRAPRPMSVCSRFQ